MSTMITNTGIGLMSDAFQPSIKPRRRLRPNWFRTGLWLWLGLVIAASSADAPILRESQVKAVYLFNFANFVTWPATAFDSPQAPFRICVLGEDQFKDKLDLAVENEQVEGRPVEVKRLTDLEQTANCQIVFVSKSEQRFKARIFEFLKQRPILTVSDMEQFLEAGGMIQFYHKDNKVRFFIRPQTLTGATLKVSSRLLKVGEVVEN
jgi:hypothetical protein